MTQGATLNSIVEHLLMVHWIVISIPHGGSIELFHIPSVLHNWCNKDQGMYCPAFYDGVCSISLAANYK